MASILIFMARWLLNLMRTARVSCCHVYGRLQETSYPSLSALTFMPISRAVWFSWPLHLRFSGHIHTSTWLIPAHGRMPCCADIYPANPFIAPCAKRRSWCRYRHSTPVLRRAGNSIVCYLSKMALTRSFLISPWGFPRQISLMLALQLLPMAPLRQTQIMRQTD